MSAEQFSVIIPTKNRADALRRTLQSILHNLDYAIAEVIVVNNGSTDNTTEVFADFQSQFLGHSILMDAPSEGGLLAGRHIGVAASGNSVLAFLDDDVDVGPQWGDSILAAFGSAGVQLMGGPSVPDCEERFPEWVRECWRPIGDSGRMLAALSLIDLKLEKPLGIDPSLVWGLNYVIRKSTLVELGGFHPDCVASEFQHFQGDGETGLSAKIRAAGVEAVHHPGARVIHRIPESRLTLEYFEQRSFYQGVCDSYTRLRERLQQIDRAYSAKATFVRKVLRAAKRAAYRILKREYPRVFFELDRSLLSTESGTPKSRCSAAYHRGYCFHQECARRSWVLRQWIKKCDYWNFSYPELESSFVQPPR